MHHLNLLQYAIKRFLYKTFARNTTFANSPNSCQDATYKRLDARIVCMSKILVTEIAMV